MSSKEIKYYSTNHKAPVVGFREALLTGLAPDKGLYMPESIPLLDQRLIASFKDCSYAEIAFHVLNSYLNQYIPSGELLKMCREAYSFDIPLEPATPGAWIMRLDQGPTASFKDFAARMMGKLMNWFQSQEKKKIVILTATSGDTGSAVANAYYGFDYIDVVVLYPEREVTDTQRRQMTTLGGNIRVIALNGKFDHCQALVKQAFADPLLKQINLSSANSINIGRLLPQSIFYFYAWSRVCKDPGNPVIFSVPSGNFGDLMGGLIAREMGLPVSRFLIATNANKEVPDYLHNGTYHVIAPSLTCLSSAMNVGHPSNMARIVALYGGVMDEQGIILQSPDLQRMRKDFWSVSISDEITLQTIRETWREHSVLLEPHGAVAWAAVKKFQAGGSCTVPVVSLETAHPGKFPDEIRKSAGIEPPIPPSLMHLKNKEEHFSAMENDYSIFRSYLLEQFG